MVRLSSMADYAVVTMVAAARHDASSSGASEPGGTELAAGTGFPAGNYHDTAVRQRPLNATYLACEVGLPVPTVQKLVSLLAAANLLTSLRGAGGGFLLARPAATISLAEIIEAVEGPIALTPCVEPSKHDCSREAHCSVRPHWDVVNTALRKALADVPLTRLACDPSPETPLLQASTEGTR